MRKLTFWALLWGFAPAAIASQKGSDDILLKVYTGRWEVGGPEGVERQKETSKSADCTLKRSDLVKAFGPKKTEEVIQALDNLYSRRSKPTVSMLFRQVEPSHELVGLSQGQEFTIERSFSTRVSLERPGATDPSFGLVKEAEKLCK